MYMHMHVHMRKPVNLPVECELLIVDDQSEFAVLVPYDQYYTMNELAIYPRHE